MPFQVGQRVGDYEIVQMLGAGGMGHVYRVRNIISNRSEAMKVLLPDLAAEQDLAMRFISEIRTLAGFDHPNIAQLRTALQADNQLVMVMEFVEGYTLEQIAGQRHMPIPEVAGYISQALSALAYAHDRGVIHRDIKPANLMVTSHGILKLMDFGIAKSSGENHAQTKPGTTMGSLYYMSPEQVRGSGVDPRSDIYSVGIMLYELLAGRRPFEADTTFSILNQQLNVAPQPPIEINPSLPPQLNAVILRALAKDPAQRFQNAEEFRAALRPFCTAPSGQEVFAPVPQSAPEPVAAAQPQTQATFTSVPPPPTPQPPPQQQAYGQPQAYAQQQYPPYTPPPRSGGGNKGLWIATGAIAVILALVGVGFAVPHMLHTHAASSAPEAVVSTTPDTVATTATPATDSITPANSTSASTSAAANAPAYGSTSPTPPATSGNPMVSNSGHAGSTRATTQSAGNSQNTIVTPAPIVTGGAPPQPANNAALDEAQERMMQMNARASTAKRGVAQIRSQQEASGLGLRGDVESAESRLDGYMQAANGDLNRGNAAGAARNLDKAESELAILEKFLGR